MNLETLLAAGPISRIRRTALQPPKLLERNVLELSMMSTLAVWAGFASHRRHHLAVRDDSSAPVGNCTWDFVKRAPPRRSKTGPPLA